MKRKAIPVFVSLLLTAALLLSMMPAAFAATSRCDYIGHDWGSWKTTKSPTCTAQGSEERTCNRCGKKETKSIGAKGHSFKYLRTEQEATCTEDGIALYTCPQCSAKENRKIKAKGHDWDEGVITTTGFLEASIKTYTCKNCGETKTEEVQVNSTMSGHSIMDMLRNGSDGKDDVCDLHIVTQPEGGFISHDGGSLQLTVKVEGGEAPYTYVWRRKYNSNFSWDFLWPWRTVDGAEGNTCNADLGNYSYYCQVYDDEGHKVNSAEVSVDYELYIDEQPENANIYGKETVTLYCKAAGGTPFGKDYDSDYSYYWFSGDGEGAGYGQTVEVYHEGGYYCIAEDSAGNQVTSGPAIVYSAEPLNVIAQSENQFLKEGETVDLFAQFSGGVLPYEAGWESASGDELETKQTADDTWSITVTGDGTEKKDYFCTAKDAMGETVSAFVTIDKYREPLTIVRTESDPEVTNEKKASLLVEVTDGTDPYTYTLLNDGIEQDSMSTHGTMGSFSVDAAGWYAIYIEDAEGRTAQTQYMEVGDSTLKIVEQPKSVEIPYAPNTLPSFTMTCKAVGNPDHLLMYQWQGKSSKGWVSFPESPSNSLNQQEVRTDTHHYMLHQVYRCIVRDTVTGVTVTSDEASVTIPMKVNAYPADNGKTIIVEVTGGFMPYTINCIRERAVFDYKTPFINNVQYSYFKHHEEVYDFPGGISSSVYAHSTTYTIRGIKVKDRHLNEDDTELYWTYTFTVTDSHGVQASDQINYKYD